jgi:hypothetical protein
MPPPGNYRPQAAVAEWKGEKPLGTVTIGYGHTGAADAIKANIILANGATVFGSAKIEP